MQPACYTHTNRSLTQNNNFITDIQLNYSFLTQTKDKHHDTTEQNIYESMTLSL